MEAIRQMSDIRFVWQYNGPALANPPANLFTAEWLPQQKLLGKSTPEIKNLSPFFLNKRQPSIQRIQSAVPISTMAVSRVFREFHLYSIPLFN